MADTELAPDQVIIADNEQLRDAFEAGFKAGFYWTARPARRPFLKPDLGACERAYLNYIGDKA